MRHRPPVRAALRPLAALAAIAAALAAGGAPAQAAIARDDCLVEVPDRARPVPPPPSAGPRRRAPAPAPDDRSILRTDAPAATPSGARPPATMRKVPIDCAPTPEREIQARARGPAQGGSRNAGAGAHIA